jgi:hypothetical protein
MWNVYLSKTKVHHDMTHNIHNVCRPVTFIVQLKMKCIRFEWMTGHCIVFCLLLLVIVLSSVFWSLYCLLTFSFGHCIVLKKKTEYNTMTKRKRQKTIQWPKAKERRQYNDQKKKSEDNTMTKRQKTIQWPKAKDRRQYNDPSFIQIVWTTF